MQEKPGQDRLIWSKEALQRQQIDVDKNPPWPWSAMKRTLINVVESYLEKSEYAISGECV